jgi:putative transposase
LTERRKQDKYQKQVHSQVLQDVLLRLDKAYQAFFKGIARYPRFKRRGKYNSFTYPQIGGFSLDGKTLRLGLIGKVKVKTHRSITGKMKTCTIIKDIDQWYACITVEEPKQELKPSSKEEGVVGIDLGLLNLAVFSNGEVIENPKFLNASVQMIRYLQKSLSRKKYDSRNRSKARMALAKAWRRVRRQRDDYAHKVSAKLALRYNTVVFEDLQIPKMVKNHNLAAAIMDATWGKLRQLTAYKVERRGGRVIIVNPSGTSQKCSGCGVAVTKGLLVRTHKCSSC